MDTFINRLKKELDLYWKWSRIDEEKYSNNEWIIEFEEWEYPNWNRLMELASKAISNIENGEASKNLVVDVLTVMALDNEVENLLDECELILSDKALECVAQCALEHCQWQARWQVAELLGRKNDIFWEKFLLKFINDPNKYVERRALISLSRLSPNIAQEIAFEKIKDEDDYLRLVALRTLKELSSPKLKEAVEILKDDSFTYIQNEINIIRG
ncbi:HEAT repeat domain-containing protein [Wukongibacter baidiensis]|uniref:HEAT repeat domain-containing protein n=1 Tax=Wukongibacter baidiensis TaxID=1723361 RepID=UPI003D7FFCED